MKAIFDTNILVDYINGFEEALQELTRYEKVLVSRIIWIEFLTGAKTADVEARRRFILDEFELIELDEAISQEAVRIRQRSRLKLADAIILATARVHGLLLVTRNHRDFPRREPDIRIPY
jgi:predicted nucleic acid-binding protein